MPISNYPSGFANGLNVRGLPILNTYGGNVFWVDSGAGSNGNKGTFDRPFATLDYAVGKCTASNGDVIFLKPGHAETIASAGALDLDVAGITIVGLGTGTSRPTFTFATAISADMDVDAADITVINCLFVNGINNLTAPIDVNAANFAMIDCETRDNDTNFHCDDFIQTDANASGLYIEGWIHDARGGAAGAQTAISIVGGDDITIIPKWIVGNFATACIENVTTAATNLQIFGSANFPAYLRTSNSADVIVTCVATTTGRQGPNLYARLQDDAANITEAFVGDDMEFFQPIAIVNADGQSSMNTNITASTD
jgi:hypothetical protein